MRTLRFTLAYEGTDFAGWQRQPGGRRTIQGELEEALSTVARERVRVVGASRTDAGVHARGQVASTRLGSNVECRRLLCGANALLPDGVVVREVAEASEQFHARRSATGKTYRYAIWNAPYPAALERRLVTWHRRPLCVEAMAEAARHLLGRHDFTSFATEAWSRPDRTRELRRLEVTSREERIHVVAEGDAFLYHMVRGIVGTLLQVGEGRLAPGALREILAARRRPAAGPNAPPQGLCLERVEYPRELLTP